MSNKNKTQNAAKVSVNDALNAVKPEVKKETANEGANLPNLPEMVNASLNQNQQGSEEKPSEAVSNLVKGSAALEIYRNKGVDAIPENLKVEIVVKDGVIICDTIEQARAAIRHYIKSKIYSAFGIRAEKDNTFVTKMQSKGLFINGLNRPLKLDSVRTDKNGAIAESLPEFAERNKAKMYLWLVDTVGLAEAGRLSSTFI